MAVEVVQTVKNGKWHSVWWPADLERRGTVMLHVGVSYKPDQHPRRPIRLVERANLCGVCFPRVRL